MDIASIENKRLMWSILMEEEVFNGIREEHTPQIITIFETAINTVKNMRVDNNMNNIATLNKEVIRKVIPEIAKYKSSTMNPTTTDDAAAVTNGKYKSADMHEARIRDITSKLKIHEDDMNSFLILKKPAEINFADSKADDDRPIGEEMDQLIQAALASRARELEVLQVSVADKKTVSFLNLPPASDTTAPLPAPPPVTAAVSASAAAPDASPDQDIKDDIDMIFNKLKRNNATEPTHHHTNNVVTSESEINDSLRTIHRAISEIQRDLRYIKDKFQ
jgi:hypothetical protein